jgi:hypothetical protein
LPRTSSRDHGDHGTPIEEAPFWALAILAFLLSLMAFPALIGLLHGFGLWHGERLRPALAAIGLAVGVVLGLATRRRWRRPRPGSLTDERPFFARFSTWLITVVLYPNLLVGAILLLRDGPPPDYVATAMLGLLLSVVQGLLAWTSRRHQG